MRHEYDDEQINDASRTAANYGSCGELHSNYLRRFLDALPDQQDEWEECAFEDIQKGDRVKRVKKNSDGTISTIEGPATFHHLTGWGTYDYYLAFREDDSQDNITLYRIPTPVVHPDPAEHPYIKCVHRDGSEYDLGASNGRVYSLFKDGRLLVQVAPHEITYWTPAKVIADE